jgi:hypothetical protein
MYIFWVLGFLALGNFSTFAAWMSLSRFGSVQVEIAVGRIRPADAALWLLVSFIYQMAIEAGYAYQLYTGGNFLPWSWIGVLYLIGLFPLVAALFEMRRFPSFSVPNVGRCSAPAVRAAILLAMLIHLAATILPLALVALLKLYPIRWM